MFRKSVLVVLLLVATISQGKEKDFSQWVSKVRSISKDSNDNFQINIDRVTNRGDDQTSRN